MKNFLEFMGPVILAAGVFIAFVVFLVTAIRPEKEKLEAYISQANKWAATDSVIECLSMDGTGYKFRSQTAKGWVIRGGYDNPAYRSSDGYNFVPLRGMSCVIFKATK